MRRIERYCLCAVALLYVVPVVATAVWAVPRYSFRSIVTLLLVAFLFATVAAAVTRTWRWFFLLQFPVSALSVAFVGYTLWFAMLPGTTLARLLVGVSWEEAIGFARLPTGHRLLMAFLAWSGVYLLLALRIKNQNIFSRGMARLSRWAILTSAFACIYCAIDADQMIDGISLDPVVGSLMFLGGNLPRASADFHGSTVVKVPYGARGHGGEEVHVLVIGESVRRDSWSTYGYTRVTTPYLDSIKNDAVFLSNMTADANLTEWAVPILLTGMLPESYSSSNVRGNILDLAKEAGYTTSWLVNQDIDISRSVGVAPDHLEYPPDLLANINGRHTLDEALLPAYSREIGRSGAPRFIGIHMMGSHWEYYRRYPAAFRRFGTDKDVGGLSMVSVLVDDRSEQVRVVDSYDNSMLYTDWFLQQLIEKAKALDVPATLTYVPDHGEDLQLLDGDTGHGGPAFTPHAFSIPSFTWMNQRYRELHPDLVAALKGNAAKDIRSHNVFYTEAEIMGITWGGFDASRSYASERFVPDVNMKLIAGGVLVARPIETPALQGTLQSGGRTAR